MSHFHDKEVMLLPTVFPPDTNTPLLAEIISGLAEKMLATKDTCRVYEMGAGSGAAIVYVAQNPQVQAFASDISPMAALNIKVNALWWGGRLSSLRRKCLRKYPKRRRV
ncbi:MAG: hypothetical protein WBG70_04285 [Spirulinaceae cyanobacterium]